MKNYLYYHQLKIQQRYKKEKKNKRKILISLLVLMLTILTIYCLIFPQYSGKFGATYSAWLKNTFGYNVYLIVLFIILATLQTFSKKYKNKVLPFIIKSFLLLLSLQVFAGLVMNSKAGIISFYLAESLKGLFGTVWAYILTVILFLIAVSLITRISFIDVMLALQEKIIADWQQWQEERRRLQQAKLKKLIEKEEKVSKTTAPSPPTQDKVRREKAEENIAAIAKTEEQKPKLPAKQKEAAKDNTAADKKIEKIEYIPPPLDLLEEVSVNTEETIKKEAIQARASILENTLKEFGIQVKVKDIIIGPVVTRYEIEPAPGVKVQSIVNLADNISLSLHTTNVRIIAPVPGKGVVGIEVPNPQQRIVSLKEVLMSKQFQESKSKLTIALGKTIDGVPYVTDLSPMPHLLIAGATGSGKSVCLHSIIVSILYKSSPDEVKFLMIDPKRLELPFYEGIPHLYNPHRPPEKASIITDPREAAQALEKLVTLMEYRYQKFAKATVRNIDGYNQKMEKLCQEKEFYIVVIIDELADLMLTSPKEVEDAIMRLAQMARAVGIHLVLATQRPSVDIITGVIKANLPARIAFQVLSKADSRVILDTIGAEDLLGHGDMLFLPSGASHPIRLQGSYISEKEIENVTNYVKKFGKPHYPDFFSEIKKTIGTEEDKENKELILAALSLMKELRRVSSDLLRSDKRIGHKYAYVLSVLERDGFIYKAPGAKSWEINFDKVNEYINEHQNLQE
jgi:S-DNA-T family DNA segregation ATPase FtsK/SpoIIIE